LANLRYIKVQNHIINNSPTSVNSGIVDNIRLTTSFDREQSVYDANYKAVYHLQGNSLDSTVYGNDGTETSVDWEEQNNDVGLLADGANTKIDCGTDTNTDNIFDGGGHVKVIISPRSDGETNEGRVLSKRNIFGWMLVCTTESGGFLGLSFYQSFSTAPGDWRTPTTIPLNEVTEIDIFYNSDSVNNNPTIMINGIKHTIENGLLTEFTTPLGTRSSDSSSEFLIGNHNLSGKTFDGLINNPQLSDKTRPSNQAIATYNAEKADSDMVTAASSVSQ